MTISLFVRSLQPTTHNLILLFEDYEEYNKVAGGAITDILRNSLLQEAAPIFCIGEHLLTNIIVTTALPQLINKLRKITPQFTTLKNQLNKYRANEIEFNTFKQSYEEYFISHLPTEDDSNMYLNFQATREIFKRFYIFRISFTKDNRNGYILIPLKYLANKIHNFKRSDYQDPAKPNVVSLKNISKLFSAIGMSIPNKESAIEITPINRLKLLPMLPKNKNNITNSMIIPFLNTPNKNDAYHIYWSGHGLTETHIGGLELHDAQELMQHLQKINTTFLHINSCFFGGKNWKKTVEYLQSKHRLQEDFPNQSNMIISSSTIGNYSTLGQTRSLIEISELKNKESLLNTDSPYFPYFAPINFKDFFNGLSNLEKSGNLSEINLFRDILSHVTFGYTNEKEKTFSALRIPRVMIGKNYIFSTIPEMDESIIILHEAMIKAQELELQKTYPHTDKIEKTLALKNKKIILLTTPSIGIPIKIFGTVDKQTNQLELPTIAPLNTKKIFLRKLIITLPEQTNKDNGLLKLRNNLKLFFRYAISSEPIVILIESLVVNDIKFSNIIFISYNKNRFFTFMKNFGQELRTNTTKPISITIQEDNISNLQPLIKKILPKKKFGKERTYINPATIKTYDQLVAAIKQVIGRKTNVIDQAYLDKLKNRPAQEEISDKVKKSQELYEQQLKEKSITQKLRNALFLLTQNIKRLSNRLSSLTG